MTTETPVTPVKASKNSKKPTMFFSDRDTQPFNDVQRFDERKQEFVMVPGLTEEEKVEQGYWPAPQYKNEIVTYKVKEKDFEGNEIEVEKTRQLGRFEKTPYDREKLASIKKSKARNSGWIASDARTMPSRHTLIVHLINNKKTEKGQRDKTFKTTYSFKDVAESEINTVLGTIINLSRKDANDKYANHYSKYYFNGKAVLGNGKG